VFLSDEDRRDIHVCTEEANEPMLLSADLLQAPVGTISELAVKYYSIM
jgi:hypothetical protein